jgi:hypothetical protein
MATQADGTAWEEECTSPGAPNGRQGFSSIATIDFYRGVPPSGFTKGLPAHLRSDKGEADIPSEIRGTHFFGYKPYHLAVAPPLGTREGDQRYAGAGVKRRLRWRDLDPGQSTGRRERLLVQPSDRHDLADLRQRGAASARPDQRRRTGEHRGLCPLRSIARDGRSAILRRGRAAS